MIIILKSVTVLGTQIDSSSQDRPEGPHSVNTLVLVRSTTWWDGAETKSGVSRQKLTPGQKNELECF
jgi:hypothetical protein